MQALLNAIAIRAATLSSTFPGGYHRDRAPEGTTSYPYIVSVILATPSKAYYGGRRAGDTHIRLSAIGVGHNATGAAMETMTAAFDDVILTLTTGVMFQALRISDPLPTLYAKVDGNGNEWWQWSAEYIFSVGQ